MVNGLEIAGSAVPDAGMETTVRYQWRLRRYASTLATVVVGMGLITETGRGQQLADYFNPVSSLGHGLQLYGVTVFTGYSTFPVMGWGYNPAALGNTSGLGPDVTAGGGFSLGWQKHSQRTNLSFNYSAMYDRMFRYSSLSGLNQYASFGLTRKLGGKWSLNLDGNLSESNLAQFLFSPTIQSELIAIPATFDDLATAVIGGQYNNQQIATLLTGTAAPLSPANALLYGDQILTVAGQIRAVYKPTSRLSMYIGGVTAGGQYIGNHSNDPLYRYANMRTSGLDGGVGFSYSLTPRTQLSADLSAMRMFGSYYDAYTGTATFGLGRKLSRRWFAEAHGGVGLIEPVGQNYSSVQGPQAIAGASLGYKTFAHTLMTSYSRTVIEPYGYGAGNNSSITGSWDWNRPGRSWGINSTVGYYQLTGNGIGNFTGWMAGIGWTRRLNSQTSLMAQYVYMSSSQQYFGIPYNFAMQSVRLSANWSPQSRR
jgi:hypothetical protein